MRYNFLPIALILMVVATRATAGTDAYGDVGLQAFAGHPLHEKLTENERQLLHRRLPQLLDRRESLSLEPLERVHPERALYVSTGAPYQLDDITCRMLRIDLSDNAGGHSQHPFELCRHRGGWRIDNRLDQLIRPTDISLLKQQLQQLVDSEDPEQRRWTNVDSGNTTELTLHAPQMHEGQRCRFASIKLTHAEGASARGHYRFCRNSEGDWVRHN
ncbi:hypothetical protein [Motiliproteus sediminis]|uniref:hypothetical protein n=1 Tax=Motiliproteus sediminis TaxID=1468178 RepID=UPI001AEF54CE|nr:hypothetical protein [Motiliproteus sediminis]